MLDGFARLFVARPITQMLRDLLDIFIVAYVIYRALLVLRGTRAIQMGVGLGVVFLVYLGAKIFNFVTLLSLLGTLLSSIILIVVVVFQNDIRRALIRMGGTAWLSGGREQQSRVIDEVVAAATELARHRMGALIAFEQDANILEFVKSEGIPLECTVTRELLVTLFVPESVNKLHDGAVLIRDLKIARAGVFFPMPETKVLDAQLGSRHRAALGITEETDAVVVVVSEERGTISFCFSGNIVSNLDGQSLRHALLGLFGRANRKKRGKKTASIVTPAPSPVRASIDRPTDPIRASKEPALRSSVVHTPPLDAATEQRSRSEKLEKLETKGGPMPAASAIKTPPNPAKVATSTPMKPTREPERPSLVDPIEAASRSGEGASNPATTTPTPRSTFVPTAPAHKPGEDS